MPVGFNFLAYNTVLYAKKLKPALWADFIHSLHIFSALNTKSSTNSKVTMYRMG